MKSDNLWPCRCTATAPPSLPYYSVFDSAAAPSAAPNDDKDGGGGGEGEMGAAALAGIAGGGVGLLLLAAAAAVVATRRRKAAHGEVLRGNGAHSTEMVATNPIFAGSQRPNLGEK